MHDLLEYFVRLILDSSIEFEIIENEDEYGRTVFTIEIAEEYKPRLIGKSGRTVSAIYNLISLEAKKSNRRVHIKISD